MFAPGTGTLVLSAIVTAISAKVSAVADASTMVVAVALLLSGFESGVLLETEFVSVRTYPAGLPVPSFTTREKLAVAPFARVGVVQMTTPLPPTAGVMHVQPAGTDIETKVAPAGIGAM